MNCAQDRTPENMILRPSTFVSKCLSRAGGRYNNIEREILGILHGLEKFHHYLFTREEGIVTDHRPLIVIFKKDKTRLSLSPQQILLRIHQFKKQMLYKPDLDLFIPDWL